MAAPEARTLGLDVGSIAADLGTVGSLARLQLEARRLGLDLELRSASPELLDLIAFVGLEEVLAVEPGGKPEEREERVRVEEERQLPDQPV